MNDEIVARELEFADSNCQPTFEVHVPDVFESGKGINVDLTEFTDIPELIVPKRDNISTTVVVMAASMQENLSK
jgi:hypothetical protein